MTDQIKTEQPNEAHISPSELNAWLDTKWCEWCKSTTHNDTECWCTRPANWKPFKYGHLY